KPVNCVVHPGAGNPDNTLVNALLHHAPELQNVPRGGIVHRIDKDTTGLLVIARNLKAHNFLVTAIQERKVKREYETIVYGEMITGGSVDQPIGRHPKQRTKMSVRKDGKAAVTHYRIIKKYNDFTHCRVTLETGRTHQIRVHMAHILFPIVGDPIYANKNRISKKWPDALQAALQQFNRQALHAAQLTLQHPSNGETMTFTAPLPQDMKDLLELIGFEQGARFLR
nr:RluA family pseudouridine synthase [Gammaproteobacteria bacterium]